MASEDKTRVDRVNKPAGEDLDDPGRTVIEPASDVTRLESADSRDLSSAEKTMVGDANAEPMPSSIFSGQAGRLRGWEIVKRFPAQGGEADVYLVRQNKIERIFKLYRWGIQPKIEVLDRIIRLSNEYPDHFVQVFQPFERASNP